VGGSVRQEEIIGTLALHQINTQAAQRGAGVGRFTKPVSTVNGKTLEAKL